MEKIAIISDVHGNITALNAVLSDIIQIMQFAVLRLKTRNFGLEKKSVKNELISFIIYQYSMNFI